MTDVIDPFEKLLDQVIAPLTAYTGPALTSPSSGLWALTDTGWQRVPALDQITALHDDATEALHALCAVIHTTGQVPHTIRHEPISGIQALAYLHRTGRDGVIVRTLDLTDLQGCVYTRVRYGDADSSPLPLTSAERARHRVLLHLADEWSDADDNPTHEPIPAAQRRRAEIDGLLAVRLLDLRTGFADGAGIRCLASAIALLASYGEPRGTGEEDAADRWHEREETIAGWLRDWVADGCLLLRHATDIAASLGVRLTVAYRVHLTLPLAYTVVATDAREAADLVLHALPALIRIEHPENPDLNLDGATVTSVTPAPDQTRTR